MSTITTVTNGSLTFSYDDIAITAKISSMDITSAESLNSIYTKGGEGDGTIYPEGGENPDEVSIVFQDLPVQLADLFKRCYAESRSGSNKRGTCTYTPINAKERKIVLSVCFVTQNIFQLSLTPDPTDPFTVPLKGKLRVGIEGSDNVTTG